MGWSEGIAAALGSKESSAPKSKGFTASALEQALSSSAVDEKAIPGNEDIYPPSREEDKSVTGRLLSIPKKIFGDIEAAGSVASGLIAQPVGAVAGIFKGFTGGKYGTPEGAREAQARASEIADSLTYRPRSEAGQEHVETLSKAVDASKLAGLGPNELNSLSGISAGPQVRVPVAKPKPIQSNVPAPMASVGAAGVDPVLQARTMAAKASPEIQAAVEKAGKKIDLKALERHVEADTLPVPVPLTKGQATQDVSLLSNEQNMRGKHPEVAKRMDDQNKALIANTTAIKESAAPDVYATTTPEHGETLIHAYKSKDATLNGEISKRYQALKEANGGAFPLDSKAFVEQADKALHKELLFDHVPPDLRKTLDRLRDGGSMTFENFESLRTNLARVMRSQTVDGNAQAAASTIRSALEDLPMPAGAEHLKPLADAARMAARERFALMEADPAYKAVVMGKASADKFIDKYVIGADLKHVETMKKNLASDPLAIQTVRAGTINRLKSSAGIIDETGNFSQAGYNKALEKIKPKLSVIFEPEHKEQLEALGRVARHTQAQPRGSFVNNSNTATALMAEGAKSAAEGAANVAAGGVPVGTWTRKFGGHYLKQKSINEALQSGAGIKLKDVGK